MSPMDETGADHFDWLPAALAAHGRPGPTPAVDRVTLPAAGGILSGLRWGDAEPTVVFLHGAGQNAHTWDLVAALADLPSLAIDLPGHGHSEWRTDRDYGPQRTADTVADALDRARVRPEVLVGMSLGGLTTIALLGARPDLARRAMIIDVLPHTTDPADPTLGLSREALGQVALIDGPKEFASIDAMLAETARAAPGRSLVDLRRGVVHNAVRTADGRYRWRYDDLDLARAIPHRALWAAIEGSAAPFLLVRGGASAFVPAESVEHLTRVRPDATTVTIDGAPHAVQSFAPAEVARLLRDLLNRAG